MIIYNIGGTLSTPYNKIIQKTRASAFYYKAFCFLLSILRLNEFDWN